ncbi:hypothetical protein [Oceanobacillus sp. CF4.6]|uniref:hypothetical protein n=1 Tax=Oceanobacillus sp. CF4.6 TaxID=3373080 RepID=UPI003EE7B332
MIEELERAKKLLNLVFDIDAGQEDARTIDDIKVIIAKSISEINTLQEDNYKLRQMIGRNIS